MDDANQHDYDHYCGCTACLANRCGDGPYVIFDRSDGHYIGREPDGNIPAYECWPTKLNRHVMHFPSREAAQAYLDGGGDPLTLSPRILKVRRRPCPACAEMDGWDCREHQRE